MYNQLDQNIIKYDNYYIYSSKYAFYNDYINAMKYFRELLASQSIFKLYGKFTNDGYSIEVKIDNIDDLMMFRLMIYESIDI